jgi:hypothetical protein
VESRRDVFSRGKRVLIISPFGRDVEQGCDDAVADAARLREEAFTLPMLRTRILLNIPRLTLGRSRGRPRRAVV